MRALHDPHMNDLQTQLADDISISYLMPGLTSKGRRKKILRIYLNIFPSPMSPRIVFQTHDFTQPRTVALFLFYFNLLNFDIRKNAIHVVHAFFGSIHRAHDGFPFLDTILDVAHDHDNLTKNAVNLAEFLCAYKSIELGTMHTILGSTSLAISTTVSYLINELVTNYRSFSDMKRATTNHIFTIMRLAYSGRLGYCPREHLCMELDTLHHPLHTQNLTRFRDTLELRNDNSTGVALLEPHLGQHEINLALANTPLPLVFPLVSMHQYGLYVPDSPMDGHDVVEIPDTPEEYTSPHASARVHIPEVVSPSTTAVSNLSYGGKSKTVTSTAVFNLIRNASTEKTNAFARMLHSFAGNEKEFMIHYGFGPKQNRSAKIFLKLFAWSLAYEFTTGGKVPYKFKVDTSDDFVITAYERLNCTQQRKFSGLIRELIMAGGQIGVDKHNFRVRFSGNERVTRLYMEYLN